MGEGPEEKKGFWFKGYTIPPYQERKNGGWNAAVEEVDGVEHFGAAGAGEGLAEGEGFLVLSCHMLFVRLVVAI